MIDAKELIERYGGASALARKLGFAKNSGAQRVHNWIKRGVPAQVIIANPDIFMPDYRKAKKRPNESQLAQDALTDA